MTRMFGGEDWTTWTGPLTAGFSQAFYDAYHAVHPRSEPHYDQRIRLYELYHHLNHALMFGGGYTGGALRIMDELADWAEGVQKP
jgi:fructosamine-3-kinase